MTNSISALLTRKEIITSRLAVSIIGISAFVLFTWLGAYARIPLRFTPVPITLQTFFVFLSGAILGRKLGSISQAAYIVLGAIGLPFFVMGSFGIAYMAGPTGGYLLGFVLASYIIGNLLKDRESLAAIIFAFTIGAAAILLSGGAWLAFGLRLGVKAGFLLGVLPFIPGCALKIVAASIITKKYIKRSKALFY